MADVVDSQLIANGPKNWAYVFTNVSDGTGESSVTKVDGSASGPLGVFLYGQTFYPLSHIKIDEIEYDVKGMQLKIIWDAPTPQNAIVLSGFGKMCFHKFGGLWAAGADGKVISGATGKINFSTLYLLQNPGYTVFMRGRKGIPSA